MPTSILVACIATLVAWQVAGLADWLVHRHTRIESTSGVRESVLHLAMLVEMGVFFVALMWLPPGAFLFGWCLVLVVLHEFTVYADLRWAVPRREVSPLEQLIHSAQEYLPLVALALVAAALWQALPDVAPGSLGARMPPGLAVGLHAAGAALVLLYAEELWRCVQARARGRGAAGEGVL